MQRAAPSPPQLRRTQLYRPRLGRAASMIFSILLHSSLPEELRVCDRMRDVSRSLSGISKSPSPTRPGLAGVHRDCHAACGQANSATPLETGAALEGALLPEAQRPSAENTSLRRGNKSPSGNRPCHPAIPLGCQAAASLKNLRRVPHLEETEAWVRRN